MPNVSGMVVGVKNHTYLRVAALYHTTLATLNSSLPDLCELVMRLTSSSRKLLCPAPTIALLSLSISSFYFFSTSSSYYTTISECTGPFILTSISLFRQLLPSIASYMKTNKTFIMSTRKLPF